MTFFYNLNKTLDAIREKPELIHGQLNERDMGKHNNKTTGFKAVADKAAKEYGSKAAGERVAGAQFQKMKKAGKLEEQDMEEGLGDAIKKVGSVAKKVGGAVLDKLGHGSDADMMRDLQKKMGATGAQVHGKKSMATPNEGVDKEAFAALAEPKDKITFADKIAGAKKEVDEMLGDVAAEAMKSALSGGQKKLDKNKNGKLDANDFAMLRKGGKQETDEGWDDMLKDVERRRGATKKGEVTHGHKHDITDTGTGRRVQRRTDPNTGYSVGADAEDKPADGEKRSRGRPKKTDKAPERVTANATKHKGGRKTNEADDHDSDEVKQAMSVLKKAGYKVSKGEQELDEKAVSKKQQKFMGMVHATQKGEKAPSKEVAKVAKSMGKKDAEDFASTKHKGLPEKAPKKKEKTEEAGGTKTPTASSGFSYGQGIYDSMNFELEQMIAESINVNMSTSTEGNNSLTVTATDEDATKLAMMLKSAGLGGEGYGGSGYKSACGCDAGADCGCGEEMDEAAPAVSDNSPDWPTNQETAQDNFEYSGGLNKPKSTGQTTVPVIAGQDGRDSSYADEEQDAIKRMMEMAGIKEAKAKPDFLDADKDGDKKEPMKAALKDKDADKVEESIFALTNQWKAYKG